MQWLPFAVSLALACVLAGDWWATSAAARRARDSRKVRIVVTGSRGKSGTVRLIHAVLNHSEVTTYAKITGAVAEEIRHDGDSRMTRRIGPISATEMLGALRRAGRDKCDAVVFECMAVAPKLITFVVNEVVRPNILVIPTVRLDHLEDEGHSLDEITRNIISPLTGFEVVITGDTDLRVLQTLRKLAREKNFRLVEARVHESQPVIPEHHPVNVAVALAIATQAGIAAEHARAALLGATHEPNAGIGWWLDHDDKRTFVCDLGKANDVQSAAEAIRGVREYLGDDVPLVPVIANRWDRPLRGRSFVAALTSTPDNEPVVLSGDAYAQSRRVLARHGVERPRITRLPISATLSKKSLTRLFARWHGEHPEIAVLLLENDHSTAVRLLRARAGKHGRAVRHNRPGTPGVNHD